MDYNKFFQSKSFHIGLLCLTGIIILLLVLKIGIFIGLNKANFSYRWQENYHRNFAGPKNGFMANFSDKEFIDSHGVFGQVIKVEIATSTPSTNSRQAPVAIIIVKGRNDMEQIILVDKNTTIKQAQNDVKISDLRPDTFIVIIGESIQSGQIQAKFIRIMPTPSTSFNMPIPRPMRR